MKKYWQKLVNWLSSVSKRRQLACLSKNQQCTAAQLQKVRNILKWMEKFNVSTQFDPAVFTKLFDEVAKLEFYDVPKCFVDYTFKYLCPNCDCAEPLRISYAHMAEEYNLFSALATTMESFEKHVSPGESTIYFQGIYWARQHAEEVKKYLTAKEAELVSQLTSLAG